MAVDSTNILLEIGEIVNNSPRGMHRRFEIQVYTGLEWITPIRIEALTTRRDYINGYADAIFLDVMMSRGDFAYGVEPHKDNIRVDVITTPTLDLTGGDVDDDIIFKRYRGVVLTKTDPGLSDSRPHASNRDDLNQEVMEVQFQLIEENVHQLRMVTVGRTYRKILPIEVLRAALTEASELIVVPDQERVIGVDVAEGYNETRREAIVIDHGTKLTHLVTHLQEEEGGLYSKGVGCFLQNNEWYVYPLYDLNRFEREERTLTIIRVPPNRFTASEKTWRIVGQQVTMIANASITAKDTGFDEQVSQGNAVRVANANNLLTFGKTENNKITLDRGENMYEFTGQELQHEGLTNAQWGKGGATSNPFKHYSRMARQGGQILEIEWMHSKIDLLYPGMPIRLYLASDDEMKEYHGTLLGANERYTPGRPGPVQEYFVNEAKLLVFVNRIPSD